MKPYIITFLAIAMTAAGLTAQTPSPRIRTSAPPEKTAQPSGAVAQEPQQPRRQEQPKAAKRNTGLDNRFMAVKTNVAYDAVAVLNLGFEMQVSRKLTVDIPVIWSLWDWKQDLGLRIVAVQPEVRYWFGTPGRGHAVGVNAGIASYNFRHDDIRYQNTAGRPLVSAALGYTYALPLDKHWSAEFSLALGYANVSYNRYYNIDNGARINSKTKNYFGPTKIGITLNYRLGK